MSAEGKYCSIGPLAFKYVVAAGKQHPSHVIYTLRKRGLLVKHTYQENTIPAGPGANFKIYQFTLQHEKLKNYEQLNELRASISLGVTPS